jgi:hypothetical protein
MRAYKAREAAGVHAAWADEATGCSAIAGASRARQAHDACEAARRLEGDLVRDCGGDVSTQQAAVIDPAVRTKLMLDSIDAWLLTQPSLVNARKRCLLPIVRERQQLADALARYMAALGLQRRVPEPKTLKGTLSVPLPGRKDTSPLPRVAFAVRTWCYFWGYLRRRGSAAKASAPRRAGGSAPRVHSARHAGRCMPE